MDTYADSLKFLLCDDGMAARLKREETNAYWRELQRKLARPDDTKPVIDVKDGILKGMTVYVDRRFKTGLQFTNGSEAVLSGDADGKLVLVYKCHRYLFNNADHFNEWARLACQTDTSPTSYHHMCYCTCVERV